MVKLFLGALLLAGAGLYPSVACAWSVWQTYNQCVWQAEHGVPFSCECRRLYGYRGAC
jgi:hypothetical protein